MIATTPIRKKALEIYNKVKDAHHAVFIDLQRLRDEIRKQLNLEEIVDVIAILKRSEDLLRDSKTEVSKNFGNLEEVACRLYVASGSIGEPIRTEWVTGSPNAKTLPKIPSKKNDLEAFTQLCSHFGLNSEAINYECFRPHWPGMVEYITQCEADFKPLPPGVNKDSLLTQYTVTCRWRPGIEPEALL